MLFRKDPGVDHVSVVVAALNLLYPTTLVPIESSNPWTHSDNHRLNHSFSKEFKFTKTADDKKTIDVIVHYDCHSKSYSAKVTFGEETKEIQNIYVLSKNGKDAEIEFDTHRLKSTIVCEEDKVHVFCNVNPSSFDYHDTLGKQIHLFCSVTSVFEIGNTI